MDWSVFFAVIVWTLVVISAAGLFISFLASLDDMDVPGWLMLSFLAVLILGGATIGGMGWAK